MIKAQARRFIPVFDRRYPLAANADAYRWIQTGQQSGVAVMDILLQDQPAGRG